jgi:hypothetical protein
MLKRAAVVVMLAAAPAGATDPCAELRWADGELAALRKAQAVIKQAQRAQCPKAPRAVCASYAGTAEALGAGLEMMTAIRELRRGECRR